MAKSHILIWKKKAKKMKVLVGRRKIYSEIMSGSPAAKACRNASNRFTYSHYTNLNALLSILSNKELKATRIDLLDDRNEGENLKSLIEHNDSLPYIVSLNHKKDENISLWYMYTKPETGVKVSFTVKKKAFSFRQGLIDFERNVKAYPISGSFDEYVFCPKQSETHIGIYISIKDVVFDDKEVTENPVTMGDTATNATALASTKSTEWAFLNESRIVAEFRSLELCNDDSTKVFEIENYSYLMIPIHFDQLENIHITFGPWMGEELKKVMREYLSKIDAPITFEDSKFCGVITRK